MPELNFDSSKISPIGDFSPLPVGDYIVTITSSEKKTPKLKPDGTQEKDYFNLTLTVQDGEYKGRKLFHGLHVENSNPEAADIAKRTLSAICAVTKVPRPKLTEELHDKPFTVTVAIRPASGTYSASNEIKGWKYSDGSKIKAHTTNAVPAGIVSSGGKKGSLPWEKK